MFPQVQGPSAPAPQPAPARPNGPGVGYGYDSSQVPPVVTPQAGVPQPGTPTPQQTQPQPGVPAPQPAPAPQPNLTAQPAPVQQVPAQAQQTADLGLVLNGENVPPQFRGKTVGEAMGFVTGMLNILRQGGASPAPQAPPAPATVPTQTSTQPAAEFFRDPGASIDARLEAKLPDILKCVLGPTLAMVERNSNVAQAQIAQQQFIAELGPQRYQALLPYMSQYLASSPPETLGNIETWRMAAKVAAGELYLGGRQIPTSQQPAQPQPQPQAGYGTPAAPYPVQAVGPGGQPIPGLPSFFTESPNGQQSGAQRVQLTALQEQVRQAMNMDYDTYTAWLGGVVRR